MKRSSMRDCVGRGTEDGRGAGGRRGRAALVGIATVGIATVVFCSSALAATEVSLQGTLLVATTSKSTGNGKGKGKGKDPKEANRISITFGSIPGSYTVADAVDVTTSDPACTDFGAAVTCPGAGVTSVFADSGRGNDSIAIGSLPASSVTLNGGDGNDTLIGSDDPRGELLGAGKGNDRMFGGAGPDRFIGDNGFDTVSYGDHRAGVRVTIGSFFNDGNASDAGANGARDSVARSVERVKGTSANDVLKGSPGADVLIGRAGNDRLKGKKGRDVLKGKNGIDVLLAKDGTRDKAINCGKGRNKRERAKFDKRIDPRPKSC